MAEPIYCFADEAGNFDFSRKAGATRYFVLATVTMADCSAGTKLLDLRRRLALMAVPTGAYFHASEDRQLIRDIIYEELAEVDMRIDTTILEKAKTEPLIAGNEWYFYKLAWYIHFKYMSRRVLRPNDRILVVAAKLTTKKFRKEFAMSVQQVVQQVSGASAEVANWAASTDPCLWIADYCAWAIQRKYEQGDPRSYDLIKSKVQSEFQPFAVGPKTYY